MMAKDILYDIGGPLTSVILLDRDDRLNTMTTGSELFILYSDLHLYIRILATGT